MERISKDKQTKARKSISYFIAKKMLDIEFVESINLTFKESKNLGFTLIKNNYIPDFSIEQIKNGEHLKPDIIEPNFNPKNHYEYKKSQTIINGEEITENYTGNYFEVYAIKTKYNCYLFQYGGIIYIYYKDTNRVFISKGQINIELKPEFSTDLYYLIYKHDVFGNKINLSEIYEKIKLPFCKRNLQKEIYFNDYTYLLGDFPEINDFYLADKIYQMSEWWLKHIMYYNIINYRKIINTNNSDFLNFKKI